MSGRKAGIKSCGIVRHGLVSLNAKSIVRLKRGGLDITKFAEEFEEITPEPSILVEGVFTTFLLAQPFPPPLHTKNFSINHRIAFAMAYNRQLDKMLSKCRTDTKYNTPGKDLMKYFRARLLKLQADRPDLDPDTQCFMVEKQTWHFHVSFESFPGIEPSTVASAIKVETPTTADSINLTGGLLDMISRHEFAAKKINEHLAVMKTIAKQENDLHQAKCAEIDEHKALTSGNMSNAGIKTYIKKLEGDLVHERDVVKQKSRSYKECKERSRVKKQKYKNFARKLIAQLVKRDIDATEFEEELNKIEIIEVEEDIAAAALLAAKAAVDALFVEEGEGSD
ncbi:uncharacterized protein PAC_17246 [Phialocephala subalpina]|uniref:Uncharacterized protein n=1 Tax=Phialocephala subalpina TaxID=576137 RepID=A0A1L7XQZ1_9HELO|nr:uncharacterized protein PAC_17246 [Phialocephala subalpina]